MQVRAEGGAGGRARRRRRRWWQRGGKQRACMMRWRGSVHTASSGSADSAHGCGRRGAGAQVSAPGGARRRGGLAGHTCGESALAARLAQDLQARAAGCGRDCGEQLAARLQPQVKVKVERAAQPAQVRRRDGGDAQVGRLDPARRGVGAVVSVHRGGPAQLAHCTHDLLARRHVHEPLEVVHVGAQGVHSFKVRPKVNHGEDRQRRGHGSTAGGPRCVPYGSEPRPQLAVGLARLVAAHDRRRRTAVQEEVVSQPYSPSARPPAARSGGTRTHGQPKNEVQWMRWASCGTSLRSARTTRRSACRRRRR